MTAQLYEKAKAKEASHETGEWSVTVYVITDKSLLINFVKTNIFYKKLIVKRPDSYFILPK